MIYTFPIPQDILDVKKDDVEIGMVSMDSYTESQYKKYYDHPLCNPEQKVAYAKALYRIDTHNKDGEGLKADHLKKLKVFASNTTDQAFINWLCNNSPKISQVKTEIVRGAKFEEVCELYKAYTEDNKEIFRTEPAFTCDSREYQRKIRDKALELFQLSRKTEILIYLSTRAGKSLVSLEIAKLINEKLPKEKGSILIITAYPNAEDSFRKPSMFSQSFKGCDYISVKKDGWTKVKKNGHEIIFCSYQMTIGDTVNGKPTVKQEFIDIVEDNYFGTIIFDETHTATDSERFEDVLMPVLDGHYSHIIHLSGTPFNDILSGRFSPDQIITFDFIDFLNWCHKNPGIVKIPNMNIHNVQNYDELRNQISKGVNDKEVLELVNTFRWDIILKDSDYCKSAINYIFGKKAFRLPGEKPSWFNTSKYKKVIMYVPPKTIDVVCDSFDITKEGRKKYVQLNGTKYRLIKLSGSNQEKSDEDSINKILEEEDHVLTVTCRKEIVGVTLPRLDTLLMFCNTESAELFVQMIFRLMTEFEGKNDVHVFCFNPNTSLNAFQDFAKLKVTQRKDNGELYTFNDVYKAILGAVNLDTLSLDTFDVSKIETPEVFLKEIKNLNRGRNPATLLSNLSGVMEMNFNLKVDGEEVKQQKKSIVDEGEKEDITEANRKELEKEAEARRKEARKELKNLEEKINSGNATPEDKSKLEDLKKKEKEYEEKAKEIREKNEKIKKIRIATQNLDKIIFVNKVDTWKDLVPIMNEMFDPSNPEFWEKILGDNQRILDDYICTIRQDEKEGKINPYYFSKSSPDDISCPVEILNKFYEVLRDGTYKTVLDPTAGMGAMLMFAHEKLGIPKELCFGVEKDHLNYLICQKFGFVNVIEGDFMKEDVQKELNINIEKNTKNVYRGVLFENDKNGKVKVDLVISNPPYGSIGGPIIYIAKNYADKIICLMPLSCYKKKSDELWRYVESMDLADPEMFEDADITNNLCICKLRKDVVDRFKTYEELSMESYGSNILPYIKACDTGKKDFKCSFMTTPSSHDDYSNDYTFAISQRVAKDGIPNSSSTWGYKYNVLKSIQEIPVHHRKDEKGSLYTAFICNWGKGGEKRKENFTTFAYKGRLLNFVILQMNKTSGTIEPAIPRIDWEAISDTQLWKEGKYDEAVLDVMGLKWDGDVIVEK